MTVRDATLSDATLVRNRIAVFAPLLRDRAGMFRPTLAQMQQMITTYGYRAVIDTVSPFAIVVYTVTDLRCEILFWASGTTAKGRAVFLFLANKGVTQGWASIGGWVQSDEDAMPYLSARFPATHMLPHPDDIAAAGFGFSNPEPTDAQLLAIRHYVRFEDTPAHILAVG